MRAPDEEDERFSEVWCKLLQDAAHLRFGPALQALANLVGAARIVLVGSPAAPAELAVGGLFTFDPRYVPIMPIDGLPLAPGEHGVLGLVRRAPGQDHCLVAVRQGAPFAPEAVQWLRLALPHLRAALELAQKSGPGAAHTTDATAFTRMLPTPCMLTDEAGRCLECSDSFHKALESLGGMVRTSRVVFSDPVLQDAWRRALQEGHATATSQSVLATSASGNPWKLHIVPFPCTTDSAPDAPLRPLLFVGFERLGAASVHARTLPSARPLTKAELEVLASLLLGHTAKVIARARGASVNTVRSQITSILSKTEHRTQKELIASFSTSAFQSQITGEEFDSD